MTENWRVIDDHPASPGHLVRQTVGNGRCVTACGWAGASLRAAGWRWFIYKDMGDDRWKRRRKKAAEKVKALASGRLVVVPTGASS